MTKVLNNLAWVVLCSLAVFSIFTMIVACSGCAVQSVLDPNTGQAYTFYSLDPNSTTVKALDTVATIGTGIGAAVSPFLSGTAAVLLSTLTGVLVTWKKLSAKLKVAKVLRTQATAAATTLVTAIETFKAVSPDAWNTLKTKIKDQLTKQGVDTATITGVIEEIRASITTTAAA